MRLAEVVGHRPLVERLLHLRMQGRLPHALLLEGPPGCGRRTLALALAQALLCEEPHEGDACGSCRACQLCRQGEHPDLVALPSDLQARTIPVDMVRDQVVDAASRSPLLGSNRAFVIPAVERLQAQRATAANALLKVLEEPPAGTMFLLTTTNAGSLLPTICSRVQIARMLPLTQDDIRGILEGQGLSGIEAERRAGLATGGVRGLTGQAVEDVPVELMRQLLFRGYDLEVIRDLLEALPPRPPEQDAMTDAAWERWSCGRWLDVLVADLRHDLRQRAGADIAAAAIRSVTAIRAELDRNLSAQFAFERLALVHGVA